MQIPPQQISRFQTIYKEEYGEDISEQAALKKAMNLVRLVTLIYQPMKKEEFERIQKEILKIQDRINRKNKV